MTVGTVWRLGANAATTLQTDLDLTLGGLAIRAEPDEPLSIDRR